MCVSIWLSVQYVEVQQLHIHSASCVVFISILPTIDDSIRCRIDNADALRFISFGQFVDGVLCLIRLPFIFLINSLHEISVRLSRFSVIVSSVFGCFFIRTWEEKKMNSKTRIAKHQRFCCWRCSWHRTNEPNYHTHKCGTTDEMKWPNCHLKVSLSVQCAFFLSVFARSLSLPFLHFILLLLESVTISLKHKRIEMFWCLRFVFVVVRCIN